MQGKWIWLMDGAKPDDYCEFVSEFEASEDKVQLNIAADSNYAIYLNGRFVDCGQYACYPSNPVMDQLSIKVKKGINKLKIIVYYVGDIDFSTYYFGLPGLFFELYENNKLLLASDENILSARSKSFETGRCQKISPQLGFSFAYNATKENVKLDYQKSEIVNKPINFTIRENKKLKYLDKVEATYLIKEDNHYLIDLKKEQTGFIYLDFVSDRVNNIRVTFGEHIVDGKVRDIIGNRNFSFEYKAKRGRNKFFSPFRRFGCRYLEVFLEKPIKCNYIGLIPTVYPFIKKPYYFNDELTQKIYDTCVYTLTCCYHEHYEDCPWREQSFYVLDSRNQMIAGYYAFKNMEQVRSALKLISQDNREDGLLSICYPAGFDLTIPSFSLFYFQAIYEYYKYSKDITLINEVYPKLVSLIDAFIDNMGDGLVLNFKGGNHWNFYEWRKGLDYPSPKIKYDVILNNLFVIALSYMSKISKLLNKENNYEKIARKVKRNINKRFYDANRKLYFMAENEHSYSKLGNALAILSKTAKKEAIEPIINELINKDSDLTPVTLSMKCFVYDALISIDKEKYKDFILNDIRVTYKNMLDNGATTFWETELGEKDFDNAGSLCHGWSAMPIYYYHLYKIGKSRR